MTQRLDTILTQLRKTLDEKGISTEVAAKPAEESRDLKADTRILKEFLKKSDVPIQAQNKTEDDPRLIVERTKALSGFIGTALSNNGKPLLSGTIELVEAQPESKHNPHSHEKHEAPKNSVPAIPFSPPPEPIVTICPSCVIAASKVYEKAKEKEAEAEKEVEKAKVVEASTKNEETGKLGNPAKMALPASPEPSKVAAESNKSTTGAARVDLQTAPLSVSRPIMASEQVSAPASVASRTEQSHVPDKPKNSVASFFNAFKPGAKTNQAVSNPTISAVQASVAPNDLSSLNTTPAPLEKNAPAAINPAMSVAWFKHIQSVESALRIGDIHFADSLLSLLFEVSASLSAEANIGARLESLRSRVLMDRKQYAEVETGLTATIKNLESTKFAKNIAVAYCWHALAQCYQYQKKADQAEAARKKAIEIADAAVGEKDPEAMYFREPLS